MTATVPRTGFSTDGMPGRDGWSTWCEAFAPLFDIRCEGDPAAFRARVDAFDLQTMVLARMTFGGVTQQGVRSRDRIRHSGLDHYAIEFCLRSDRYTFEGRKGPVDVRTGDMVVFDLGQPCTMVADNSDSISLTVPRAVLESYCPGVEQMHGMRIAAPGRVRLLGEHMLSLHRHLPHMTPAEAVRIVETSAALAGACLAPSSGPGPAAGEAIEYTLFDRAQRYIAARLDDPRLSPADIGAAIGMSRSSLYRLFQPLGGVAHYIRDCRLRRVHAALRDPAERRSISELAYASGFTSAAHFSRAFRALFGCPPGDVRELGRAGERREAERRVSENFVEAWLKNMRAS